MEIPKIEQKKKQKEKQQEDSQILNELTEGYDSDIEQQLSAERIQAMEMEIQQDEHPVMEKDDEDPPDVKYQKKKLKRELRAEAMRRQEEAARTVADLMTLWNAGIIWMKTGPAECSTMRSHGEMCRWNMAVLRRHLLFRHG